jgi:tRNA(Ile)-lysidine synthase
VLSRVLGTIREHGLLAKGDRVLVAFSGGPDSTALLHVLAKLAPRLGFTLTAASVDHGLRPESAEEAREVGRRCRRMGVACEVVVVDVGQARRPHVSVQEAARNTRLAALERAAARLDCTKIALGHTADDQAETVLFRILRGTGIAGLAGIPYQRGLFVRPLLDVRRAELLAYLAKRKIDFLSDPSNANRRYARSRIRHDVLPALARENPRVVEALLSLARQARGVPSRPWLGCLPKNVYVPRRALDVVDRLVRKGAGTHTVVVGGGALTVGYGRVTWVPSTDGTSSVVGVSPLPPPTITGPGTYRLAEPPAPAIEITRGGRGTWPGGNRACFDPCKIRWPLELRASQPGDRMAPRGGRGSRKLSDLLIDAKIPRAARPALPVLCDAGGTILFVPGLRPSERGRPGAETREWFEVRLAR